MVTKFSLIVLSTFNHLIDCSCSSDILISSASDLNAISGCSSYSGEITVEGYTSPVLRLDSILSIASIKIHENKGLKTITFGSLKEVTNMIISNHTDLFNLDLSSLKNAKKLHLLTNPKLRELKLSKNLVFDDLHIEDSDILGFLNEEVVRASSVKINSNKYLVNISLPNLKNLKELLISGNESGSSLDLSQLTELDSMGTISNLRDLKLFNLNKINSNLVLDSNSFIKLDLQGLTQSQQILKISNNLELTDLNLENFEEGSTLIVEDNEDLTILKMNSLKELRDSLRIAGNFQKIEFTKLGLVGGSSEILVADTKFCKDKTYITLKRRFKGKNNCGAYSKSKDQNSSSFSEISTYKLLLSIIVLLSI